MTAVAVALAVICLIWTPGPRVLEDARAWNGLPIRVIVFLAGTHVAMFAFGARRGSDLRRELTRRRAAQAQLHHLATHDGLTGLANRSEFLHRLEAACADGGPLIVALLDLDRFKQVNDTLGHHVGDELLRAAGDRMRHGLPPDASLARMGGDEFAVLLPLACPAPAAPTTGAPALARAGARADAPAAGTDVPTARAILTDLVEAVRRPFPLDGLQLEIDISIGYVAAPGGTASAETLMLRADAARHAAKAGTLGVVEYSEELGARERERAGLYEELKHGIGAGQLQLVFQPKLMMADERVVGVEALVRWDHPTRGRLAPDAFLHVAERTGLIRPLTDTVLDQALRACRTWQDQGLSLPVAVNLSPRSLLDTGLPLMIEQLLATYGLAASWLELEVTETTAMTNPGQAAQILQQLSELGITLAIDDYGTGHASLAYLSRLPVHALKIDKSFVQRLGTEPADRTIVRSTIDLAHNLGLKVVAEGVEDDATWHTLRTWGCDQAQGFWMSRPLPAATIPSFLAGPRTLGAPDPASSATSLPPSAATSFPSSAAASLPASSRDADPASTPAAG